MEQKRKTLFDIFGPEDLPPPYKMSTPAPPPKPEEQAQPAAANKIPPKPGIIYLPIDRLDPYPEHMFKEYSDVKLHELADDIAENGVISPIYARPSGDRYQILAGHNRTKAAKLAGLSEVPCLVKDCDDDTAELILVSSNLYQRETMLPSEKAFAYKRQMEILKKRGKNIENFTRNPDDDGEIREHSTGWNNGDKTSNIYRYIRLCNLLQAILDLVDTGNVSIKIGADLSYLEKIEQETVHKYFFMDKRGSLDIKTAKQLRWRAMEVDLTDEEIDRLMRKSKKEPVIKKYSVRFKKVERFIPAGTPIREAENKIIRALEFYHEHHPEEV